jgi:DNA modification methylase
MKELSSESVDLVITSPPYPLIKMWDSFYSDINGKVAEALKKNQGYKAFELMHKELDPIWDEIYRVLKKGGIACINIGDATRTLNGHFALYPNHSRIQTYMQRLGFSSLPGIIWRKQTNVPIKFMGSGMMPPGAYITLEHEYVLILRKGNKKEFKTNKGKQIRQESTFFEEERNLWFSDVWTDLKGTSQNLFDKKVRNRSAAFPFELPYRLITMFSVKEDLVLDPFLGTGTTIRAAMASGRNSVGYEIDENFKEIITSEISGVVNFSNKRIKERFEEHFNFIEIEFERMKKFIHVNKHYKFPVKSSQETQLLINQLHSIEKLRDNTFEVVYSDEPQKEFVGSWDDYVLSETELLKYKETKKEKKRFVSKQRQLFDNSPD